MIPGCPPAIAALSRSITGKHNGASSITPGRTVQGYLHEAAYLRNKALATELYLDPFFNYPSQYFILNKSDYCILCSDLKQ